MRNLRIIRNTVKHWYLFLLIGLLLVGVGLWAIFFPNRSLPVIALAFSLAFLISGIGEIFFAVANRDQIDDWGWNLVSGIFGLTIGALMLLNPEISVIALSFYVGFLVFFYSLKTIILSFDLKKYLLVKWGNFLAIGIIGLLISFLLLAKPFFTDWMIIIFASLGVITVGSTNIYFAFKLRKIKVLARRVSDSLLSRYEQVKQEIESALLDETE
ncbi:MAG: Putative membrane protein [Microgenomates bacterium 39_6]|nr:MAG: Putative membrane protein [Microgenomates bacterium 39_6]